MSVKKHSSENLKVLSFLRKAQCLLASLSSFARKVLMRVNLYLLSTSSATSELASSYQ